MYDDAELLHGHLWASHKHRLTVPVLVPGQAARAVRAGANLATERLWGAGPGKSSSPMRVVTG